MTIKYNKIYQKRDGRRLIASGPRDVQKHQKDLYENKVDEIAMLREDLSRITSNMAPNSSSKALQDSRIDEAMEELVLDLERKYVSQIDSLNESLATLKETLMLKEERIKHLENKLDRKDMIIESLSNNLGRAQGAVPSNNSPQSIVPQDIDDEDTALAKPSIDKIIIDPTDNAAVDKLESHVKVKEMQSSKPAVSDNLNKLRSLMGKKTK